MHFSCGTAGTRRCAVCALERRVSVFTWESRMASEGLRAEVVVLSERRARRMGVMVGRYMVLVRSEDLDLFGCWVVL